MADGKTEGVKPVQVTLAQCPVGLFWFADELCVKTEYGSNEGRIDAFIVSSGEFFWGHAPQTIASQRASLVTPVPDEVLDRLTHQPDTAAQPVGDVERVRPVFTPEAIQAASEETARLTRELDITNADHIALWLEANKDDSSLGWLACRIVEAHEAAIASVLADPPRHKFWGAGETDCPSDLKAGNGELHTLRCKVCGEENLRNDICRAQTREPNP